MAESKHKIRLDSAPGVYTLTAHWLGLEGDEKDVCNKYELSVDDEDVTVAYFLAIPIPEGRNIRPRLSVYELGRGFLEMLESALGDEYLMSKLHGLDIDQSNIRSMIAELEAKY